MLIGLWSKGHCDPPSRWRNSRTWSCIITLQAQTWRWQVYWYEIQFFSYFWFYLLVYIYNIQFMFIHLTVFKIRLSWEHLKSQECILFNQLEIKKTLIWTTMQLMLPQFCWTSSHLSGEIWTYTFWKYAFRKFLRMICATRLIAINILLE